MTRALVTGATAGIGAAFVHRLAKEGADLVLVARGRDRLETMAEALRQRYGGQVGVLAADLSRPESCAAVEERLRAEAEPVNLLVNNAGFSLPGTFPTSIVDHEEELLAVNVRAVMRLSHAVLPGMLDRNRGGIINISSIAGFVPTSTGPSYAASKAWVTSFTESLAMNLAGTGVRVSVVCPGLVRTEFHERSRTDTGRIPRVLWLAADDVARIGLADHRRGRLISIPGWRYKAALGVVRLLPRGLVRAASALVTGR